MADLRLVGVHDDGEHLLLSGSEGEIYLLPLDEALRTAVGKNTHRFARTSQPSGTKMSPREIQSLIRAGASAADVAEQAALTLEQVRRYEGPVLAEREYIARQARNVQVAAASTSNDGLRSAFGEVAATLEDMVQHRLRVFGIDPKSLQWDAWRDQAGTWTVSADFEPGTQWAATSIGEPTPALWRFHAARKSLHNANRWAQQLSELEPLDSPVPERRLSAVADKPFDVEAHSTTAAPDAAQEPDQDADAATAEDGEAADSSQGLLDLLRSRRGVRLGANETGDDELAAMLGTHVPGAHPPEGSLANAPEVVEPPAETPVEPPVEVATSARDRLRSIPFLKLAPSLGHPGKNHLDGSGSVSEVSTGTGELVLSGEPVVAHRAPAAGPQDAPHPPRETEAEAGELGPSDSEVAARLERKAAAKSKRSSVPSWDEIVFGTKGD